MGEKRYTHVVFVDVTCQLCGKRGKGTAIASLEPVSVCVKCLMHACNDHQRYNNTVSNVSTRVKLIETAIRDGQARAGNYSAFNKPKHLELYYRGTLVTTYDKDSGTVTHEENEYSDLPRTKTLRISFENAISMWLKNKEAKA